MTRPYEKELLALYYTLDSAIEKKANARSISEEKGYQEQIDHMNERIKRQIEKLESNEPQSNEYLINDQLPQYKILNLDENGFDTIEYTIPEGYEVSQNFVTWREANQYIKYLKDLSKDPSYMVSILGYHLDEDDYLQIIFKVRASY